MSAAKSFFRLALTLIPLLVEWVADRLEDGEDVEHVRRDIQDRRQAIRDKRAERDAEFEARFGRKPSSAVDPEG